MPSTTPHPVVTLLTQTLPRRSQSSIRRTLIALGATVHVATLNTDRLPRGTTHVLLTEQVPCPVFVLAVASASNVRLVTPAFAEDCEKYNTITPPLSDSHTLSHDSSPNAFLNASDILWIGRIWLGAYHFWRNRSQLGNCAPLHSHLIAVIGQTRPRGAARLLSPSSAFVKDLIVAAGAQLLEYDQADASTFAIVAPGLNRTNSDVVASLLDNDVICLAPAFLLDLVLRVAANPVDYLLFSSQKSLCGVCLDAKSISAQQPPLKVSIKDSVRQPLPTCAVPEPGAAPTPDPTHLAVDEGAPNQTPKISPRKRRNVAKPTRECPPAKRKQRSPKASQADAALSRPDSKSCEIIDLTCSPKSSIPVSDTTSPDSRCLLPPNSNFEKDHVAFDRTRSNDSNAQGRLSSEPKVQSEIQPRSGVQETSPECGKNNLGKSAHNFPNETEIACQSSGGKNVSPSSHKAPPATNSPSSVRRGSSLASPLPDHFVHVAKQAPVQRLLQMPDCSEAGSIQRSPPLASRDQERDLRKNLRTVEQHAMPSCEANFRHRTPTYQAISENEGSDTQNIKHLTRSRTRRVGRRSLQTHSEIKSRTGARDGPRRLRSDSDSISSRKDNRLNSTVNSENTRTDCRVAYKSESPSVGVNTSPSVLTQPAQLQRPHSNVGALDYDFEPDFHLVMASLGGQPSDSTIKRMLKSIAAPKTCWESAEQDTEANDTNQPHIEISDGGGQECQKSSENSDQLLRMPHETSSRGGDPLCEGDYEMGFSSRRERRAEHEEPQPTQAGVLNLLPPKAPIVIRNVTRSELVFLENADSVDVVAGNEDDDQICQSSLSFADWLIGAEFLVGSVSTDTLTSTQNGTEFWSRRVWLSFLEAKVLERLASPGSLNDFQISVLIGICTRLVICNFQPEMNIRVLSEMLKLRELQKASKVDSLCIILSSSNPRTISYRHRAVATIWAVVLQSSTWNSNTCNGWALLEKCCQNCFEDVFISTQFASLTSSQIVKKVSAFLEVIWIVTLTLSLRTDLFVAQLQSESDAECNMYPEYWNIFIWLFEKFQHIALSAAPGSKQMPRLMLATVLRFIADKYCEVLWPVNEEFLTACTQIVGRICRVENVSCFCEDVSPHVKQSVNCSSHGGSYSNTGFKTLCEYLFYFSRNLINHGVGNKMKHVMNTMRIASPFTSGEGIDCESRIWKVRHHVGLILSVADFVASHSNGESQVCNLLTIKSEDFSFLLNTKGVNYSEVEQKWDCILNGVAQRCQTLRSRSEGGHVYVNWLSSSVTEGLVLIKRIGGRRANGAGDRELLRAQESALWAATLKRLLGLKRLLQLLVPESDLKRLSKDVLREYLSTVLGCLSNLLAQVREWNDNLRIADVVADDVRKENLIHDMIEVATVMSKVVPSAFPSHGQSSESYHRTLQKPLSDVFSVKNLELIVSLIVGTDTVRQKKYRIGCRENCTDMLGVFLDTFLGNGYDGWNEAGLAKLWETLRISGFYILDGRALAYTSDLPESEDFKASAVVRFWWRAITKLDWVRETVREDDHMKKVVAGILIWIILQGGRLRKGENNKVEQMIRDILCTSRNMEGVGVFFEKWESYVDMDVKEVYEGANALCVQQVIERFAEDWGQSGSRNIVSHLRRGAHDMIRSKCGNNAEDGMRIAGSLFNLECQAMGLCQGTEPWIHERIADMCDSVEFFRHGGGWRGGKSWDSACEAMLEAILNGLSMSRCSEQDVELRVVVLRLVNAVGDANDLSGVWMMTGSRLFFMKGMGEDAEAALRGTVTENLGQWQELILDGVVEDRLSCVTQGGQGRALALRRLLAAARVGQHQKIESLVRAVVGRIQWNKRVESAICSDAISRLLWRQIVRQLTYGRE